MRGPDQDEQARVSDEDESVDKGLLSEQTSRH